MIQLRPRDGSDERFYAPDRDLAHIGPGLIRKALAILRPDYKGPLPSWMEKLMDMATDADMARTLAAVRSFFALARDPQIPNAKAAVEACGFHHLDPGAQILLLARLGYVVLGAVFAGLRDVGTAGKPNPGLQEILAAAEEAAQALMHDASPDPAREV